MAIPDNYIDKITKGNDSRMISPAADMVRVDNDNFDGETLDEVLDDVAQAIGEAGEVKSVTINGTKHTPDAQTGDVDLGTVQGEKGDKGDAGDVNITDGQLNELTVVNDLEHNTQGDGAVLSAYMGYVLGLSMGKITNANDGRKYNVWIGTQAELDALDEDYDANTIYIVGTVPVIAQRYNIVFNGTHTTIPSNTPTSVKGGSAFSVVVSAVSGYAISSATGTMVGGTLTKTENQDGTVTFSTSSVTGDISITASASVDSNAPIVWEDANMEAFMLGKVTHANPNYITINEAASYTNNAFASAESMASYPFGDIKSVVTKFNEWQYFTGLTKINLSNFTALTEVTMPSTVLIETALSGFSYSGTLFSGTLIQEVDIPSGVTSFDGKSFDSCAELENIIFPATLTTLVSLPNNCPKLRTLDLSNTSLGAYTLNRAKTDAEIIKLPPSLATMQKSDGNALQLTRDMPNIRYIEFGTAQGGSQISAINVGDYQGKSVSLILHTATPPTFTWDNVAPSAFYVPDDAVATYQAASGFSTHSSIIKGLSELPSGWDSTTAN